MTRRGRITGTLARSGLRPGLVGTLAWAGHAAASSGIEGAIHLTADILHLLAAAAWFGSLISLCCCAPRAGSLRRAPSWWRARRCCAFHRSAWPASAPWRRPAWSIPGFWPEASLVDTDYGRLLVVKVALFFVMLSFGTTNRLWLAPRLEHAPNAAVATAALRRIERNSLIEAGFGTAIIVIVGLLGTMPPGLQDPAIN